MGMKPYKRAVATVGTYTDRSGNEKKRYLNVGTLFQYDDGNFALKLESLPIGGEWNGFVSFYDIEDKREEPRQQSGGSYDARRSGAPRESFAADLDDEIPF